jgi:hypothetical protein
MPKEKIKEIADNAKLIVKGYAFTPREDGFIAILNLEHPECAMVINKNGEMIETNMDHIEQKIVLNLCDKNLQFMED